MRLNDEKYNPFSVALLFVPVATVLAVMILTTGYRHFSVFIPVFNDEIGWWSLTRNLVKGIKSAGHVGYNGNYAAIGNYGAWGLTPLLPYALFGKVFGWHLYTMSIVNMILMGVGLFVYALLVDADNRTLIRIGVVYLCNTAAIGFTMTSMNEGLRYSMTIILTGIVIYLQKNAQKNTGVKKTAILTSIAAFSLYSINAWLILALFVPLILWWVLEKLSLWAKLILIPVITLIVAAVEQYLVGLVAYSYRESVISHALSEYKSWGILQAFHYLVSNTFENLDTVSPPSIIKRGSYQGWLNEELFMFFVLYLILLSVCLARAIKYRKFMYVMMGYLLLGFLLGYCVLYTGGADQLYRGTNAALLATGMCAAVCYEHSEKYSLYKIIWIAGVFGAVVSYNYYNNMIQERIDAAAYISELHDEELKLSEVLDLSADNEAWDNTIAEYGEIDFWYLACPEGSYGNYMLNFEVNKDAGYAIIRSSDERAKEVIGEHLQNGHSIVLEDDIFVVLRKE